MGRYSSILTISAVMALCSAPAFAQQTEPATGTDSAPAITTAPAATATPQTDNAQGAVSIDAMPDSDMPIRAGGSNCHKRNLTS